MNRSVVWITGASRGIGAALAAAVPFEASVVNISRSAGDQGVHLEADLSDSTSWEVVARDFTQRLPAADRAVFISNAGTIDPIGFAGEGDADAYRRSVLLNAAAPQILGDAFLRAVAASGFGGRAILCQLTSGAARTPYPGWSAYGAGKAAIDQWVRTAGAEQAQRGDRVRVVAIAPGVVDTNMQGRIRRADHQDFPRVERFRRLHDDGQLADPAAVARRMWAVLEGDLENGAVLDLRQAI